LLLEAAQSLDKLRAGGRTFGQNLVLQQSELAVEACNPRPHQSAIGCRQPPHDLIEHGDDWEDEHQRRPMSEASQKGKLFCRSGGPDL